MDPELDPEPYDEEGLSPEGMHPDHPLLKRAQEALYTQLCANRDRIDVELREKTESLKVEKKKREEIGVELYGVQQQLAKLQMTLEKTHDNFNELNRIRLQREDQLANLKMEADSKSGKTQEERNKVQGLQQELDKLAATLKQVEAYNEQMKNEIAVTRRATYVAEESVSKLEKEKNEQDKLIDSLQEELKRQHNQLQLYESRITAQQRETKAAKETLAEAEKEMEAIHFEKKQLAQQWKSSLIAMARRDEALQATEEALRKQREQELAIEGEIDGFKRSIKAEQQRNEQLTGILRRLETETEFTRKRIGADREKKEKCLQELNKLKAQLAKSEEEQERAEMEKKALETEMEDIDKKTVMKNQLVKDIEEDVLQKLSDQTTMEKTAQKTAASARKLRQQVAAEQQNAVQMHNELAKIRVDVLNTQAHNGKLDETMGALDEELKDKTRTIEKYELEIRRRNDDIEKRTKEVDRLNRQYEKLTANLEDENTGPLEATVANLAREIATKNAEGKELQRRWISFQTELVALVSENNDLAEKVARLKAEHTVLAQKRQRLDVQHEGHEKEIKELDHNMLQMHTEMTKLNTMISKNSEKREILANDNFNLETNVINTLKEMESEAVRMEAKIEQCKEEKKELLAEIVECERQIMLWERKIELEKETQAALDPDVGDDVVGAMRKEIHRMELRKAELLKRQEKLIQDMERAISKRETIATKGRAQKAKATPVLTEAGLKKACAELKRSIAETDSEAAAAEARISELDARRTDAAGELDRVSRSCVELREREKEEQTSLESLQLEKLKADVKVQRYERMMITLQQVEPVPEEEAAEELDAVQREQGKIQEFVDSLLKEMPDLKGFVQLKAYCEAVREQL